MGADPSPLREGEHPVWYGRRSFKSVVGYIIPGIVLINIRRLWFVAGLDWASWPSVIVIYLLPAVPRDYVVRLLIIEVLDDDYLKLVPRKSLSL